MHNLCAQRRIVGVACTEYRKNGAMAQYIAVKARTLYALPPTVSFEQGCLVEPFAVGMHAVLRSGLAAGQTAAVIGDGTIGLMTLIAAKSQGAQVCISGPPRPAHAAGRTAGCTGLRSAAAAHRRARCPMWCTMPSVPKAPLHRPWSWCARADASWSLATTPDHRLPAAALHHRADRCAVQLFLRRGVPGLPAGHCRGPRRPDPALWQSFPLAEGAQVFDRLVHRDESLTKAVLIP